MIPHILIVDDDQDISELISIYIGQFSYTFDVVADAESALEKLATERFNILLTDLELPRMNGDELLKRIRDSNPDMIGIVMSVHKDAERVLPLLNHDNIYEYLIKPFEPDILKSALDRAFDKHLLRIKEKVLSEREKNLYEEFITTLDWKMELRAKKMDSIAQQLIHQLNISFFQGQGVGALISSVGFLMHKAKYDEDNDEYTIPGKLYKMVAENYEHSMDMVECFVEAQEIIMHQKMYEETNAAILLKTMALECRDELMDQLAIKDQSISISEMPGSLSNTQALLRADKLKIAITELMFNAMKYSQKGARIYILFFHKSSHLEVKVLNPAPPVKEESDSLSGKNEVLVFEPFVRLSKNVDDRYRDKFRYGLGLTVVKKIIDLHGANIFIYAIQNSLEQESESRNDICVTLRFPLIEG